ncbi:MAG: NDP-sugar synthase [Anaerolineae bacterium]
MIEHVIVMAASPDRSMEALTRTRPRAMLPILGKPLVAWVMDGYYNAGIRRFTVVVGEREGDVAIWLAERWHKDARVDFAPQGHRRGTASTLFATRHLIDGPVIITSCECLVSEEHVHTLATYFERRSSDVAALSLYHAPEEAPETAGVLLDPRRRVMLISEKPLGAHQDYMIALPVYAFTPRVLDYLDRVPVVSESGARVLTTAIQMMIDDGGLVGAVEASWRLRLATPDDLRRANLEMLTRLEEPHIKSKVPESAAIIPPVYIEERVTIGQHVTIGPNVYIEQGSVIGARSILEDSVVLGCQIGAGMTVRAEVVGEDRL